jgi:phage-related holin
MAEIAGWDNINVKHIWIGIEKKVAKLITVTITYCSFL